MSQDYAVIKTGGKQYRVREGDQIDIEKINADIGSDVIFENVLLSSINGTIEIGKPLVEGKKVIAEIAEQKKSDKVLSLRYKNKTRQRVLRGHRQNLTSVIIKNISTK
ncbi:MAG: 50S ribosomal protein L21 [Dehalococcoidia bacterium]|nr:50S ribosomal protein L21 [Dehalococcoidia bacterium]MQG09787.1 50S ribosomal protein L21 [SAR202 cluster bacterium]|tara:strand:- start:102 stop:425 length:324 start_codon:yes stop_codon:yes gene_type:complete